MPSPEPSRWASSDVTRGDAYDERFEKLAATGHDVHGEASFVFAYGARTVLDAGCGTGRVAIELARRGAQVVGVDLDRAMLDVAFGKAPELEWYLADLTTLNLRDAEGRRRRFQLVVAAGNVMIFLAPGTESAAIAAMARHLVPGGLLVAGFQLGPTTYRLGDYDDGCQAAGLEFYERYATWTREPWNGTGGYVVSVHRRPVTAEP